MQDSWSPLRPSRSEHYINGLGTGLSSSVRIHPLVESANSFPVSSVFGLGSQQELGKAQAPPTYEAIYGGSRERRPPAYNQVTHFRPSLSSWMLGAAHSQSSSTIADVQKPRVIMNHMHQHSRQPTWAREPKPLEVTPTSPAGYFQAMERENMRERSRNRDMAAKYNQQNAHHSTPITVTTRVTLNNGNGSVRTSQNRHSHVLSSDLNSNASSSSLITPRNAQRQASFIAAVGRHPLKEAAANGNMRSAHETRSAPATARQKSSFSESTNNTSSSNSEHQNSYDRLDYNQQHHPNELNGNAQTPAMDFFFYEDAMDLKNSPKPPYRRPSSPYRRKMRLNLSANLENELSQPTSLRERRRTTIYGDQILTKTDVDKDQNHNDFLGVKNVVGVKRADFSGNAGQSSATAMRRARPKSYVLATSASLPETEHPPLGLPSEESRELSSLGSVSSIDHTFRSTATNNSSHAPPNSATSHASTGAHRLQKFINLFNHAKSSERTSKFRPKRSRTSGPASRVSLPDTLLKSSKITRQGWLRHQELALGKSGKRRQWEPCYAVLYDQSLFLSPLEPAPAFTEETGEKCIQLPSCPRIDINSSIVDIAYEWLTATSKQRHVARLLTQTRTEHLFEMDSEPDMLSWIAALQSSSEGVASPPLHSSCSAASLASSSSTRSGGLVGSVSDARNGHWTQAEAATQQANHNTHLPHSQQNSTTNQTATSQLIMHRYKAKTSQLPSPISHKRHQTMPIHSGAPNSAGPLSAGSHGSMDHHHVYPQPGTSKELDNGEPSTPKSGRKWKKSKAAKQGSGSSSSSQHAPQQSVLGVKLADCAAAKSNEHVPLLVQVCVGVVEAHGMDTIGIYRIPGNTAAVNALKETLAHGMDTLDLEKLDQLDPRWRDVNVVSSLLKMFLRKLPEPLLTDKLYPFFIDANRISTHHNRLHKLRNLLRKLPRHHYETLKYLIRHLSEVTKNSDVNKMETRNLALMFGPSIVRPSDDNMATMVTHMSDQCKIIETLIYYYDWMFDSESSADDEVPEQHPSELNAPPTDPPQYGVGVPTGVSAASFNDMHNLIRKANEDQAAALMSEGKAGKIKNMLRRNSRRDKKSSNNSSTTIAAAPTTSKGLRIESTAPAAVNPRYTGYTAPTPSSTSVETAFQGHYQERDIDAEIESRQTVSPPGASGGTDGGIEESPSLESSLGSLPDSSRTEPGSDGELLRRKRQQDMYSARRIFIAGSAAAAASVDDNKTLDAMASHTQHLNLAGTPALEVLSEETREKIRKMQKRQTWVDRPPRNMERSTDLLNTYSPTKDMTDALSCTSDYSTTSSAHLSLTAQQSGGVPLVVNCPEQPSSSDYASSDPSPCARNASSSPRPRPAALALNNNNSVNAAQGEESRCQQKIRMRVKEGGRETRQDNRRHTIADVDTLKIGRLDKFARWLGIRKSSPDVHAELSLAAAASQKVPQITKTSPNELTPASGDEQL